MANRLKMAKIQAILELHQRGWSGRRIARELGIDRETVGRYLGLAAGERPPGEPGSLKPAISPAGNEVSGLQPNPAISPLGSKRDELPAGIVAFLQRPRGVGRKSHCEPFREIILAKLGQELSSQRIYQDLVADHSYAGSYDSVKRFVRRCGTNTPLPMRRMECAPGTEAQVDFGSGAPLVGPDGKRRKTHVFRIVLSHSRKAYSEVTFRQTTDDFLRCLENAFHQFGGVPETLVIDNLRAAVSHPDWFDPELVPKLSVFARHYGTVILPTRPYTPRHKGKVERGIGYVKDNALKGRTFASLDEQNRHLAQWEASVADRRIHGTTRQQVGRVFADVEHSALKPLPTGRFPFFQEAQRQVNRDGHVEVAKAYYSVPPEYLGRTVWVRWDTRFVRILNDRLESIAVHARHEPGRFSTHDRHLPREKISGIERGAAWLLKQVAQVGSRTKAWSEAMVAQRGIEGIRVLQGLWSLTRKHRSCDLESACDIALSYGVFRLRTVRKLITRQADRQQVLPFLDEHPLIRPLTDYSQFVSQAIWSSAAAPRSFFRHDRANECRALEEKNSGSGDCRSPRGIHPPWSGYPSPGCASAEPGSVSPDDSTGLPVPDLKPGEFDDE
jgi:transposase